MNVSGVGSNVGSLGPPEPRNASGVDRPHDGDADDRRVPPAASATVGTKVDRIA